MKNGWVKTVKLSVSLIAIMGMTACSGMRDQIAGIGKTPEFSAINNPAAQPDYQPVRMPMPDTSAQNQLRSPNSLWSAGRQTFFKDQRANKVGDILTVTVEIADKAELDNKTSRSRVSNEEAGIPEFLGIPGTQLSKILPESVNPAKLIDAESSSTSTGDGVIDREEKIRLKVAATVSQVLPNGNFVIYGRQEVRVNNEVRELQIAGIIRPEDIMNTNTISYEKIAEARIAYGGRGIVSDLQRPRYGQEFMDIVFPF